MREIARAIGKAPGTVLREELDRLAETGVRSAGRWAIRFNIRQTSYARSTKLRSIIKKTTGVAEVLRAALDPLAHGIRSAFVYGSIARGDERAGSDLDVMIVGDVGFEDVVGALSPAQEALRREINPSVYPPTEFAASSPPATRSCSGCWPTARFF